MSKTPPVAAPVAERQPVTTTHHGRTLVDDYAWLRADNWQEAMREPDKLPEPIADYLKAENAYQDAGLADTAERREALVEEMKGRIKEDDSSVPRPDGPYEYWMKYEPGGEYPIFMRQKRGGGEESVIFNADEEGKGKAYFSLGAMDRRPDHKMLAWCVDESGSEYYTARFRDLETGKDVGEKLADVSGLSWTDNQTLYYELTDE
ncbi:MAG: S9 family peptidase, partial [Pseudomonadota bacterium]